ncbi:hypothetical protein GBA65_03990 [Rubrobacter marinus]|uniref:Uncharacterized protein n=1 Tax=Rubrobacter marinus TaxID=2653852 RepID=A0A6G8PUX0_9ACTN|nr:hypothetical protein [Rubrobacter marinus]QIN77815.1 hypothetical protein GBA65_03990 [Rubrobacter marinus]
MAFFPTAFFFNALYTEALFLALSAGAVWAALVRRDLLLAGALGASPPPPETPGCCCSSLWATSGCATARSSGSAGSSP